MLKTFSQINIYWQEFKSCFFYYCGKLLIISFLIYTYLDSILFLYFWFLKKSLSVFTSNSTFYIMLTSPLEYFFFELQSFIYILLSFSLILGFQTFKLLIQNALKKSLWKRLTKTFVLSFFLLCSCLLCNFYLLQFLIFFFKQLEYNFIILYIEYTLVKLNNFFLILCQISFFEMLFLILCYYYYMYYYFKFQQYFKIFIFIYMCCCCWVLPPDLLFQSLFLALSGSFFIIFYICIFFKKFF